MHIALNILSENGNDIMEKGYEYRWKNEKIERLTFFLLWMRKNYYIWSWLFCATYKGYIPLETDSLTHITQSQTIFLIHSGGWGRLKGQSDYCCCGVAYAKAFGYENFMWIITILPENYLLVGLHFVNQFIPFVLTNICRYPYQILYMIYFNDKVEIVWRKV